MIQIDFMNIFEIFVCCMENFHTMHNVYKYEIFSCIHVYANLHVRLWNEMYVRRNGIEH
jgi:hypothetical protein